MPNTNRKRQTWLIKRLMSSGMPNNDTLPTLTLVENLQPYGVHTYTFRCMWTCRLCHASEHHPWCLTCWRMYRPSTSKRDTTCIDSSPHMLTPSAKQTAHVCLRDTAALYTTCCTRIYFKARGQCEANLLQLSQFIRTRAHEGVASFIIVALA